MTPNMGLFLRIVIAQALMAAVAHLGLLPIPEWMAPILAFALNALAEWLRNQTQNRRLRKALGIF